MLLRFTIITFSTCGQTLHTSISLASTNTECVAYVRLQNSQEEGIEESPWGWGWRNLLSLGPASIGWGWDIDTNPFTFPRYAQIKLASPQLQCRVSLYPSICLCCLDLSGSQSGWWDLIVSSWDPQHFTNPGGHIMLPSAKSNLSEHSLTVKETAGPAVCKCTTKQCQLKPPYSDKLGYKIHKGTECLQADRVEQEEG